MISFAESITERITQAFRCLCAQPHHTDCAGIWSGREDSNLRPPEPHILHFPSDFSTLTLGAIRFSPLRINTLRLYFPPANRGIS